jgi:type IV secretory pathway VirB2 component (pilin)
VVLLPRLARFFHHPGLAVGLGVILIVVGVFGLVSGDIAKGLAIVIVVVGAINLLRGVPSEELSRPPEPSS